MNLRQYFFPQILKRFHSKINTQIELVIFSGSLRLDMGNLTQSGEVIEKIWNKAFNDLLPSQFNPETILILGFGAGSAARLISRRWPNAQITGVEIDPTVIKIAKEHFLADQIPNLKIINADAVEFINNCSLKTDNWSLILVDCYLGDQFPQKLESKKFINRLTSLSPHVIINRLFWGKYQPITLDFHEKLKKIFNTKTTRTASNYLIHLSK